MKEQKTAKIHWDNGQLVIDFTRVHYEKQYRNIEIIKSDENEIIVKAQKINYFYFYATDIEYFHYPHVYDQKFFDLVMPNMVGEVEELVNKSFWQVMWEIICNKETNKTVKVKRILKDGWVELKDTNHPFEFKTNNYLIIQ